MHLHCLPQAIDSNSIVIMLASFISVPSLVSLTEKFTNSQDLMYKKLSPLSHVRVVSLSAGDRKGLNGGWTQWWTGQFPSSVGIGPPGLRHVRSVIWHEALNELKEVQIRARTFTCNLHPRSALHTAP